MHAQSRAQFIAAGNSDHSSGIAVLIMIESAVQWNAKAKLVFAVPNLYLLYKMHKLCTTDIDRIAADPYLFKYQSLYTRW
jgi:hypothetical protein